MMPGSRITIDPVRHGSAGLRIFCNIARVWDLSLEEQLQILGIADPATFQDLKRRVQAHEPVAVPMDIVVRLGCVLSIYMSLVTLYEEEYTARWLRDPNIVASFGGRSPLAMMTSGPLENLDTVVRGLLGQIQFNGPW